MFAWFAVTRDDESIRLTIGGERVLYTTTEHNQATVTIDNWENKYLWTVEQSEEAQHFQVIDFYTVNNKRYIVGIAYPTGTNDEVMIARLLISKLNRAGVRVQKFPPNETSEYL